MWCALVGAAGMNIRIVLADDHAMFLSGLCALLDKHRDLEVIAEVRDGQEAVKVAREQKPDLVIMDVAMPGMNGIEATRQITAELPGVKVLCLSMHASEQFVGEGFEGGASGYVLKEAAFEEMLRAIRAVMANQTYLSPAVAGPMIEGYRALRSRHPSPVAPLTGREREVLQLVAEGHSTKEIAGRLHLSIKTIDTHRRRLMDKLRIHSVAGLTKYAIRSGLTAPD
jgi:DNA-binding NarL/FixJ family response regulator